MKSPFTVFGEFIRTRGMRHTSQREKVLKVFLSTERHVSTDELYGLVKRRYPSIGYTTVYRTMRLLLESGMCSETDFGDGVVRFEHKYGHEHHDHLICIRCGRFIEVVKNGIERLQKALAKEHRFTPLKHKLEIFGVCDRCGGR